MMPTLTLRQRRSTVATKIDKKGLHSQSTDVLNSTSPSHGDDNTSILTATLARAETRVVNILRAAVLCVILVTAILVSTGVYIYTRNEEQDNFSVNFDESAHQVMQSFHAMVEKNLAAAASMSTSITSYAKNANLTFPFVTVPDFAIKGSDFRAQSGSHLFYWSPLVEDDDRAAWEAYSMEHRWHMTESSQVENANRIAQDLVFGYGQHQSNNNDEEGKRQLRDKPVFTIGDNTTGFHAKIWSNGAVAPIGDEPEGSGPFLVLWQQSPVYAGLQSFLNMNLANVQLITRGIIQTLTVEKKAVLNYAAIPIPAYEQYVENLLRNSQYRQNVEDYIDDLHTIISYPVFDSFDVDDDNRNVVGMLASDIYWDLLFSNILPSHMVGLICVVENSMNQTFAYRIDGPNAMSMGTGDHHDPRYDVYEVSEGINSYLQRIAGPQNRAYKTVSLSDSIQYTIRIFPSQDTEKQFITNRPKIYTVVVIFAFTFASLLFLSYSYVVEKRQRVMTKRVIENARRAAETERELNEFLSHEIRNPLSAAMSAATFVATAVNEPNTMDDPTTRSNVREDIEVVNASLHFINDFLRTMLDIYRVNKITVRMVPTDILRDILDPVSAIFHKRVSSFDVIIDCPEHIIVMTDPVRLKQVILNLVRNASKFVERGFLRVRADVVDHQVRLYVEDSGPGIPKGKQKELFAKYQESLDSLNQGTGLGLNLSLKLMRIMNGDLYLDNHYHSGIEGCPGSCFVVQLNTAPIDIESTLAGGSSDQVMSKPPSTGSAQDSDNTNSTVLDPLGECHYGMNGSSHKDPASLSELPEGLSVLFVDDDAVLRKLFTRAVKKVAPSSWTIQEASSGEIALRLCEEERFDLICLDQYMASTGKQLLGTETAQAMRTKGVTSTICGLSANDLRNAFLRSGADDFVLKPIPCKPAELKCMLQKILVKKAPRSVH